MKKILSFFASLSLTILPSTSVISCDLFGSNEIEFAGEFFIKDLGSSDQNEQEFTNWFDSEYHTNVGKDYTVEVTSTTNNDGKIMQGDFSKSEFTKPNDPATTDIYIKEMIITPTRGSSFKGVNNDGHAVKYWFVVYPRLFIGSFQADPSTIPEDRDQIPVDFLNGLGSQDNPISLSNLFHITDDDVFSTYLLTQYTAELVGFTKEEFHSVKWSFTDSDNKGIPWDDFQSIDTSNYYYGYPEISENNWVDPINEFNYGITFNMYFTK